jgi:hypothetical protein
MHLHLQFDLSVFSNLIGCSVAIRNRKPIKAKILSEFGGPSPVVRLPTLHTKDERRIYWQLSRYYLCR